MHAALLGHAREPLSHGLPPQRRGRLPTQAGQADRGGGRRGRRRSQPALPAAAGHAPAAGAHLGRRRGGRGDAGRRRAAPHAAGDRRRRSGAEDAPRCVPGSPRRRSDGRTRQRAPGTAVAGRLALDGPRRRLRRRGPARRAPGDDPPGDPRASRQTAPPAPARHQGADAVLHRPGGPLSALRRRRRPGQGRVRHYVRGGIPAHGAAAGVRRPACRDRRASGRGERPRRVLFDRPPRRLDRHRGEQPDQPRQCRARLPAHHARQGTAAQLCGAAAVHLFALGAARRLGQSQRLSDLRPARRRHRTGAPADHRPRSAAVRQPGRRTAARIRGQHAHRHRPRELRGVRREPAAGDRGRDRRPVRSGRADFVRRRRATRRRPVAAAVGILDRTRLLEPPRAGAGCAAGGVGGRRSDAAARVRAAARRRDADAAPVYHPHQDQPRQ